MRSKAVSNILIAVATIAIIWLVLDKINLQTIVKEKAKRNKEKDDLNQKLKEKIEGAKEIPAKIKEELEELIRKYRDIDSDVSNELLSASTLIEIKEYPKAIFTLTKIIENLLKEKYAKKAAFKDWLIENKRKNPVFSDFIDFAKSEEFISKEEFHFVKGLKEIRNEEGHELNVIKNELITSSAFLLAISFILKLCKKVRAKKVSVKVQPIK